MKKVIVGVLTVLAMNYAGSIGALAQTNNISTTTCPIDWMDSISARMAERTGELKLSSPLQIDCGLSGLNDEAIKYLTTVAPNMIAEVLTVIVRLQNLPLEDLQENSTVLGSVLDRHNKAESDFKSAQAQLTQSWHHQYRNALTIKRIVFENIDVIRNEPRLFDDPANQGLVLQVNLYRGMGNFSTTPTRDYYQNFPLTSALYEALARTVPALTEAQWEQWQRQQEELRKAMDKK